MSNKYPNRVWPVLLLLIAALSGCEAMLPFQKEVKDEVVLEKYKDVPLQKALTDVQDQFKKAREESLYFFSPNNYRTARSGLQAARAYYKDPERKTYVLKSIYKAEQAIKDGFEVKAIVKRELPEFIQLHNSLVILEAKKTHSREFLSMMTEMNNLIERIEEEKEALFKETDKKAKFEKDKKEIIADLKDFQLRVVKFKYLNHGELLISEADSVDARSIAPETYKATLAERDKAVAYIENNVNNLEGIQQASEQFEFAAQRLMHISRAVFNVINLKPDTHEQYVLRQEERLGKIATALKAGDLRNQSFSEQGNQLTNIVKSTVKQKENLALEVANLRSASGVEAASTGAPLPEDGQEGEGSSAGELAAQQAAAQAQQGQDVVIPVAPGGDDPEEMRKSVRLLTDQVYRLIIENDQLKGQNQQLKQEVSKIQAQLDAKIAPRKTVAPKTVSPKTKASDEKKSNKKSGDKESNNSKPAAEPVPAKSGNTESKTQAGQTAKKNNQAGKQQDVKPAADNAEQSSTVPAESKPSDT